MLDERNYTVGGVTQLPCRVCACNEVCSKRNQKKRYVFPHFHTEVRRLDIQHNSTICYLHHGLRAQRAQRAQPAQRLIYRHCPCSRPSRLRYHFGGSPKTLARCLAYLSFHLHCTTLTESGQKNGRKDAKGQEMTRQ